MTTATGQEAPTRLVIPGNFGDKVYENVKVIGSSDQGLKIVHDGGVSVLPFKSLPEPWKSKYTPAPQLLPPPAPVPAASAATMPAPGAAPGAAPAAGTPVATFDPACLVFIKTDGGSGSGFIARANGKTYIYTNAHVLCGEPGGFSQKIVSLKTAAGREFPMPYELELSDTYDAAASNGLEDMARIPIVLKEGEPFYDIGALDIATSLEQPVVAYGNSLGGDVITALEGRIVGLGSDRIEITSQFVPGNSGGPVLLADSRKVVGISTYVVSGRRDIWARGTKFGEVRRFATRPEKVTKWRKMPYSGLMASVADLRNFDRDTLSLAAACYLRPLRNNGGFEVPNTRYGDFTVKEVLVEGAQYSLGGTITSGVSRVNQRIGGTSGRMAVAGVIPVFQEFFATVAASSNAQMSSLQTTDRFPYLKQYVPELLERRKAVHEEFVKHANRFTSSRVH